MINKILPCVFFLTGLIITSCTPSKLSQVEYLKYFENEKNGLVIKEIIGGFVFTLQYKSAEYIALKEQNIHSINKELLDKATKELSGLDQYNLTIESEDGATEMLKNNLSSEQEYFERIEYFSMQAQNDIVSIAGKDTSGCILYHFERSFDLAPYSKMVLGFKKNDHSEQDRIISFDEQILGIGKLNFRIKSSDIKQIPQLVIE